MTCDFMVLLRCNVKDKIKLTGRCPPVPVLDSPCAGSSHLAITATTKLKVVVTRLCKLLQLLIQEPSNQVSLYYSAATIQRQDSQLAQIDFFLVPPFPPRNVSKDIQVLGSSLKSPTQRGRSGKVLQLLICLYMAASCSTLYFRYHFQPIFVLVDSKMFLYLSTSPVQ